MTTDPAHANDEELVAHAESVRALASGLLRDEHEAEDLAQEALAVGLTDGTTARQGLRSWLAGVTKNLARMRQRSAARRRQHEAAVRQVSRPSSPDDLAARLETERRLIVALQELREPYRSTLVARYYDGLKPGQIAKRDGVPVDTVRTRLQRGLALLRKQLDAAHGGNRRAWVAALLPFALPKGFLPGAGAAGGGRVASTLASATGAKVAAGLVTLAVAAAVVVVATGPADPTPKPDPDVTPVTVPAAASVTATRPSTPARRKPLTAGEYLRRINEGESAWLVANEVAALEPGRGRDTVTAIFPDIEAWVRRHEVVKAFVSAGHPHAHVLLEAATRDESEWVRDAAHDFLEDLFLRNFRADRAAWRDWFSRYGGRPLALALRENAREYVNRLLALDGEALTHELGRVSIRSAALWRHAGLDFAAEMRETGILERIEGYLGASATRTWAAVPALLWFRELRLDEARMREILTALLAGPAARDETFVTRLCGELARSEHAWAAGPLLDLVGSPAGMTTRSFGAIVDAVGEMDDDRAIPMLIGVMSADGLTVGLRWKAHRSLLELTGLSLGAAREDAGWWREWWKKNRKRYSETARAREIPTLHPPR